MFERLRAVVLVLVLVLLSCGEIAAHALPPSPAPTSSPAIDPCATSAPDLHDDFRSVFAYEITSAPVLHFLSQMKRVPERDQPEIFARAAAAAKTPGQHELEAAEQRTCPTLEEIYAHKRALFLVANEWTARDLHNNERFDAFSRAVGDALAALFLGDELTVDQHQAALDPFAVLAAIPEAVRPQDASTGACEQPARTVHAVTPTYPPVAGISRTSGVVNVLVSLNEQGDVRSVRPFSNTLGDRPGTADLINAAILSAAASTYAPRIRDCKGVIGTYIFAVEFNPR